KKVGTSTKGNYQVKGLQENTEYSFYVKAVANSGDVSDASETFKVKTLENQKGEKPTTPGKPMEMGITETSVTLMWTPSSHSAGIKEYEVYRDGEKIATTTKGNHKDNGLNKGTEYKYSIRAISKDGKVSDASDELKVKTKGNSVRAFTLGSLSSPEMYGVGEKVSYKGKMYEVVQSHSNYGDESWAPDSTGALFKLAN
ncbi:MAG: carbohydrate-binding protein, partial [Streptococcaceae bacterium]|nr:carbohydrate-binding protein [Streptococcaceae bacterium]